MKIDEIQELINFINNSIGKVNVCYPCEVLEVLNTRVRIKILVNDTKDFEFPEVVDVPVIHLKAGNSQITMPTTAGDIGIIFISSKNTRKFKTGTGLFYRADFDIDNAFYIGGIFNNTANETTIDLTKLIIQKGSAIISLADDGIVINSSTINLGTGGSGVARIGDTVEVNITSGSSAGTYQGTITSGSSNVFSN